MTHPAIWRRGDVVTTCLCTQVRPKWNTQRRLVGTSPRHLKGCLHDVLLERGDDFLKGRNNDVPSVRLHDVSNKSQMKHPTTFQWYVTKTSQLYASTTSHCYVPYNVSCKSQMKHLITLLRYNSTTSRSYVVATVSTFSNYFVMGSIW